jgi:tetratricopeptide (TPR) repeat protein
MLTRKVIILIVLFVFCSGGAFAESLPVTEQVRLAEIGRDLLLARKYKEAELFLQKLVDEHPQELLGYFGFMSLYQTKNMENFDFRFDSQYEPWEEKGRPMALKTIKNPQATSWDLLMAGGMLGVSGFDRAHHSRWFSGLSDGSAALHALQAALKKEPQKGLETTDPLLGIALYDYWRSHFTRKLKFLPFFRDSRREAKQQLEETVKAAGFSSVLAQISLAFIYYQEKNNEAALKLADRLLERYPDNLTLRILRGQVFTAMKQYPAAIQEFQAVLTVDPMLTKSYLFIGLAYDGESKTEEAKKYFKKFLLLEPNAPYHWRKKIPH